VNLTGSTSDVLFANTSQFNNQAGGIFNAQNDQA